MDTVRTGSWRVLARRARVFGAGDREITFGLKTSRTPTLAAIESGAIGLTAISRPVGSVYRSTRPAEGSIPSSSPAVGKAR